MFFEDFTDDWEKGNWPVGSDIMLRAMIFLTLRVDFA